MTVMATPVIPVRQNVSGIWQSPLQMLGAAWAALLLIFWRDAMDMVEIWWNSSTFNHCLLIIPILYWLVATRRDMLAQLTPQAYWPALIYVATGALIWLLGDAAGLAVARQLGLIMMMQGSVSAVLGWNVTRGVLFPVFYMFFLLPVGEEAVPMLQTLTAKMCMTMLSWSGIPAHINGIFITTPGGYFKVAEACSGVKFLIAMIAYGALVANLCFTGWGRRTGFMAVCVIVPVIANGLRAFGTIYIAEYTGTEFASGFDHVFYGWIFFGIVIAIVMATGWRFFDKRADAPAFNPADLQSQPRGRISARAAVAGVLVVAALPVGWSAAVQAQASPIPAQITLPKVQGWQVVSYTPRYAWTPRFAGANHTLIGRYRNAAGIEADVFIALYDRQSEGRELIGFGQGAVDRDSEWAWTADMPAPTNGKAERITAPGPVARDVVSFYRVGGMTTGSATQVKLATLRARLLGGNQQAAAILVSAEYTGAQSNRSAVDTFVKDLGSIDSLADQIIGLHNTAGLR
jgi:exosortase A